MSDQYGACVVLLPSDTGLPDEVVGGHHVTLTYLGDKSVDSVLEVELLQTVAQLMDSMTGTIRLRTQGIERFGEEGDAVVLTFDPHPESAAVILRDMLLEQFSNELTLKFKESETFPDFKPHMTLGYISEGFDESSIETLDIPEWVHIKGMAVWNGSAHTPIYNRRDSDLMHYGILRKSGRYPWGSGENPYQRSMAFYSAYNQLKAEGLAETDIAKLFGEQSTPKNPDFNTSMLRTTRSQAKSEKRAGDRIQILKLKNEKQMSTTAIARKMGMNESQVRALLKDDVADRVNATKVVADKLREQISETSYLDVGKGNANRLGVSNERLKTAVSILADEGYDVLYYKETQLGTGKETNIKFIAPPGSKEKFAEIKKHPERIKVIDGHSLDNGLTFEKPTPPNNVSSRKLQIRYAEDGGTERDGVIELRRGRKDLDLGDNRYAQVRIAVDGTHYLKGMAVYADDLPDGVDIRFNTNKTREQAPRKVDALKELKLTKEGTLDLQAPFGAQIKVGGQRGALNIVNEEGDWERWSKKLSSQMLSKQSETLAKQQLNLSHDIKKAELEEIKKLTNPTVKQKLLEGFADGADSSATTLKAMGLPRTNNKVLLPVPELGKKEIYAPTYRDGEAVVLIRHPHGGKFEIPELIVNNRNKAARSVMGDALDAVGINPIVAEQLSGADFDGDTVLVIPQKGNIRRSDPLKQLEGFDPKKSYEGFEGMKRMTKKQTQQEMGKISNLITDMSIKGANKADIANAVRHSMVVIDAEKHKLNFKQSEIDHSIKLLKQKYQDEGDGKTPAATLISRASSDVRVPKFRAARVNEGGPIDPKTGEARTVQTGESYVKTIVNKRTGESRQEVVVPTQSISAMAATKDARTLVSKPKGTPMEFVYADYANSMKGLANDARKELLNTPNLVRSPTAAKTYSVEAASLKHKLNIALQNAPLERQAQIVGNAIVRTKQEANPGMDADELKKVRSRALQEARLRTGATKTQVHIEEKEWAAIQAGAISNAMLSQILNNADLDRVKELATPRSSQGVSPALLSRARSMQNAGYTWAEIASALGVSESTLISNVNK